LAADGDVGFGLKMSVAELCGYVDASVEISDGRVVHQCMIFLKQTITELIFGLQVIGRPVFVFEFLNVLVLDRHVFVGVGNDIIDTCV
jgi:hypothetical protein